MPDDIRAGTVLRCRPIFAQAKSTFARRESPCARVNARAIVQVLARNRWIYVKEKSHMFSMKISMQNTVNRCQEYTPARNVNGAFTEHLPLS